MLADEKSKTKRLRSELISNLTSLITDFTDTQEESWSAAVANVQSGNEAAAVEMQNFVAGTEQAWHSGTKRKAELDEELDMAFGTSSKQREAAHTVSFWCGFSELADTRRWAKSRPVLGSV